MTEEKIIFSSDKRKWFLIHFMFTFLAGLAESAITYSRPTFRKNVCFKYLKKISASRRILQINQYILIGEPRGENFDDWSFQPNFFAIWDLWKLSDLLFGTFHDRDRRSPADSFN